MNTSASPPEIDGEAFTRAREKRGLSIKELAAQACLSTRQIQQLENGEQSAFYSAKIKVTAAKKVANLLGLADEDVFDYGLQDLTKKSEVEQEEFQKPVASQAPYLEKPSELEAKTSPVIVINPVLLSVSGAAKSKPPQKRWILWISLVAAVVFSIVNLRPLFFPEKVEEMIVAKEGVIEPTPPQVLMEPEQLSTPLAIIPSVTTPIIVAQDPASPCPTEDSTAINYKPDEPRKSADMVYVQAKSKQVVCVIDVTGKSQNKSIEPGVGTSFFGKPPFKVLTEGLSQVDIFFQGWKVRPVNLSSKTLILEPAEIMPASQANSEAR